MTEKCKSCGMPMNRKKDSGEENINTKYCIHCFDENGELKTFEEKVDDLCKFIMKTSHMEESKARELAKKKLLEQSDWKK